MRMRIAVSVVLLCMSGVAAEADEFPALPGRVGDFTLAAPSIEESVASSGWYLRLDGGSSYLASGEVSVGRLTRSFGGGPGWSLGGGIGYRLLPQWRVDATVDVVNHSRLSETVLLGNVYWDIGAFGRATPYLGVGIGSAQVNISDSAPVSRLAPGLQRTDWSMAWSLMAGTSWSLGPNLWLNTGYRYLNLHAPAFDVVNRPFDLQISGVQEHQFRVGLRYAFP